MSRKLRLNQHLARPGAATRPASDLDNSLRQPLGRAEIGAEKPLVGIEHYNQGDVREVVALGDHLGPHQNAGLAG